MNKQAYEHIVGLALRVGGESLSKEAAIIPPRHVLKNIWNGKALSRLKSGAKGKLEALRSIRRERDSHLRDAKDILIDISNWKPTARDISTGHAYEDLWDTAMRRNPYKHVKSPGILTYDDMVDGFSNRRILDYIGPSTIRTAIFDRKARMYNNAIRSKEFENSLAKAVRDNSYRYDAPVRTKVHDAIDSAKELWM